MEKRYQVFVSSTFADLQLERQKVMQTLMKMDCIPAGMELFPAADEEQFEFIKRVIDDCDYYLLIIGGRYGSLAPDGISFTEKEYDYAVEKGLKVVALLHKKPEDIPAKNTDQDADLSEKLKQFRAKVSQGRLVDFWESTEELPGKVALSIVNAIKLYPAVGWVRANNVGSQELLAELNDVRKENSNLREQLTVTEGTKIDTSSLATIDDEFELKGYFYDYVSDGSFDTRKIRDWNVKCTWGEILSKLGPYMLENKPDSSIRGNIIGLVKDKTNSSASIHVNEDDIQTIKIQMLAHDWIEIINPPSGEESIWHLTDKGKHLLLETKAVKKDFTDV